MTVRAFKMGAYATDDITEIVSIGSFSNIGVGFRHYFQNPNGTNYLIPDGKDLITNIADIPE